MELDGIDFATAPWTEIDGLIISFDARQSSRDYFLGRAIVEIERREVFRAAGFASLVNYLEVRLGWDPHTTSERRRTALALESLPLLSEEMRAGRLRYSAVRELTRVAKGPVESAWIEFSKGKNVHEIAFACKVRRPGAAPTDAPDPELFRQVLRFECNSQELVVIRSAIEEVRKAHGPEGKDLSEAACLRIALEKMVGSFEVHATICSSCLAAGVQHRGESIPVTAAELELMVCQGRMVDQAGRIRSRHIPANVERAARLRAGGKCETPFCRSRLVNVHHLRLFSEGGDHSPGNLVCLCPYHHQRVHEGLMWIQGSRESGFAFTHADGTRIGEVPNQTTAAAYHTAFQSLRDGGIGEGMARAALAQVREAAIEQPLERILEAAAKALEEMVSRKRRGAEDEGADGGASIVSESITRWSPTWDGPGNPGLVSVSHVGH